MTVKTRRRAERAAKRQRAWNRAEQPYFHECLKCDLDCEMIRATQETIYSIYKCPKIHNSDPMFPYKYFDEKKKRE